MSVPQLKQYRVNLHVLSPIHVGTGEDLDPFSYVIRNNTLYLIDLIEWIDSFLDKDKLESMMDSDNFANVRSFIADHFNLKSAVRCSIPVDDPTLIEVYDESIQKRDPRNQVLISPTMRNEITMSAYIPGSSLKGAIRTAIANGFVKSAGVTSKDNRGRSDYNAKIFGQINKDPMRWLKISDVNLGQSSTAIVEAKEYPMNPDKPLTPKGHTEVALSFCHTGKPVVYPLRWSMADFDLHRKKVDANFIIESLYRFYVTKYEEEYKKFYKSPVAEPIKQGILPLNKVVGGMRTNETLVRMGHFSHVECITLDGVRNPRTRRGRDGRPLPYGTTRTLANGIYPFGWAKLEFLDLESKPRPERKWPFPVKAEEDAKERFSPEPAEFVPKEKAETVPEIPATKKRKPVVQATLSPLETLLKELDLVKPNDMGRIGTIIQKIESLETDDEKEQVAAAIRDKIGPKAFKKHKQKRYLLGLIEKSQS